MEDMHSPEGSRGRSPIYHLSYADPQEYLATGPDAEAPYDPGDNNIASLDEKLVQGPSFTVKR